MTDSTTVTLAQLQFPQVGDHFIGLCSYFCWVLEVTPDYVVFADTVGAQERYLQRIDACLTNPEVALVTGVPIDLRQVKETRTKFAAKTWLRYHNNRASQVADWQALIPILVDETGHEVEVVRIWYQRNGDGAGKVFCHVASDLSVLGTDLLLPLVQTMQQVRRSWHSQPLLFAMSSTVDSTEHPLLHTITRTISASTTLLQPTLFFDHWLEFFDSFGVEGRDQFLLALVQVATTVIESLGLEKGKHS